MAEILQQNLLSPVVLAFALGIFAKLIRSEFSLPKDVYLAISIYLLFALGLKGGVELAHASFETIVAPALVTVLIGCITPLTTYAAMFWLGHFSHADSAAMAAHYGSVSAVTFIAAQSFVTAVGAPAEGFMPTLLALLESPGITIALALGAINTASGERPIREVLHEVLTGRTVILLVGGLVIGFFIGDKNYAGIQPFFEGLFKGVLTIFLLEMGVVAGARLGDLKRVGPFLLGLGILLPVLHGLLGVWLGSLAGLSPGGATVLAAMAASASYIAAPPAVRLTLPEANPTYYLTASLAITFPFNILIGIPIYYEFAAWLAGPAVS